jgi:DNA helicase-2/ATP-dependent DNA helicase PcrA
MADWEVVIGPPGTGKTTYLLNEVEKELARDTPSNKIAYLAFTKKAAREAAGRAKEKFGSIDLPFFRTIHSLAFWGLGLSRARVMTDEQYQDFGERMGIRITGHWDLEDGGQFGYEVGDRILFMYNLARVRGVPLRGLFDEDDDNLEWRQVDWLSRGLEEYKRTNFLLDFTDMLIQFVDVDTFPEIDVLFVDEAQDLSHAQWRIIERLASRALRTVVAGDDDQAIFRWAAADVDYFRDLPGKSRVLNQSYRVPIAVQLFASDIIERVSKRRPKAWSPRDVEGAVQFYTSIDQVDFSTGGHLVLARNAYLLQPVEAELRAEGYLYAHGNKSSVKPTILEGILAWETLRAGNSISYAQAKRIFAQITVGKNLKRGGKAALDRADPEGTYVSQSLRDVGLVDTSAIWHEALDRIPSVERAYLTAALRKGEKLTKEPRIRLSTIHGAKGGEADNVSVIPDMATRTYAYSRQYPDDECRVFYVAATRARETLNIINPRTRKHFTF